MVAGGQENPRSLPEDIFMIQANFTVVKDKTPIIVPRVRALIKEVFRKNGVLLAGYLRKERFTGGTTTTRLGVRSGKLRASVRTAQITENSNVIEGGMEFGTVYARTHVGPRGQVTTILPKNKKYLAIPLDAAKTPAGVAKGSPQSGKFGKTFFIKSKNGNLILMGQNTYAKGQNVGKAHGKVVPLFLMVKQVKIKARVHPEQIPKYITPRITKDLIAGGLKIAEG